MLDETILEEYLWKIVCDRDLWILIYYWQMCSLSSFRSARKEVDDDSQQKKKVNVGIICVVLSTTAVSYYSLTARPVHSPAGRADRPVI